MKSLSTAVWNLLNGKPISDPLLRNAVISALRKSPDYLKQIVNIAVEDIHEEKLSKKLTKHAEKYRRSPNQSGNISPEYLVLHDSYGSFMSSFWWILDAKSDVSYHYMVDTDGSRTQFVWDNKKAWHAGRSLWKGIRGLNSKSIGLAFSGNTHKREVTELEIDSMARKIIYLIDKFPKLQNRPIEDVVISHQMISPKRKTDTAPSTRLKVIEKVKELTK